MNALFKAVDKISGFLNWISIVAVYVLMFFMVVDIVLRYVFSSPIAGDYELIELALVLIVFFAIPHTQTVHGHVAVDILTIRLSRRMKDVCGLIGWLAGTVMLAIITYANYRQIFKVRGNELTTGILRIPVWPFYALVFLCLLVFTICMATDCIKSVMDLFRKDPDQSEA